MSLADDIFIASVRDILENGVSDEGMDVRPKWEDGTPAHTIKKFGLVNRYDLSKEFPIITLRRTFFKTSVKDFYDFTPDSFSLENYQYNTEEIKFPVAI